MERRDDSLGLGECRGEWRLARWRMDSKREDWVLRMVLAFHFLVEYANGMLRTGNREGEREVCHPRVEESLFLLIGFPGS